MYQLEEPIYFYGLTILVVALGLFLWRVVWQKSVQKKFFSKRALDRLGPNQSLIKSWIKFVVWTLCIAALIIALVNPKLGTKIETVTRQGVDVVFAVDVSKSMLAEDVAPNRLEKSKQLVTQIINNLVGDRVGVIGYAGSAFPQVPITTDFASAKLFLNNMNTDMVSSQGTAINEAINLSKTYYNDQEQTNRVLFIVSDGEDHQEQDQDAVAAAVASGIQIYTIGVGSSAGAPIPIKRNGILQYYKRDQDNNQVITKLNAQNLQNIAEWGQGKYIDGTQTKEVVAQVQDILNAMDKTEFEAKQFTDFKDQFQWFLVLALVLLLADSFMLERKTKWLKKLNLFNEQSDED
ncbi:VWA domain-containing protein [Flavobacteriaceae bacterium]|jgi:Ca-activated chloride channel family protein|nr:VWA domain-containing protein [Flavobacteriaceae bacterium]